MSLDLAPRIRWKASEWIKPGSLFILKENDWFSPTGDNNSGLFVYAGTVACFLSARVEKAQRVFGSEICCVFRFLIEENTYSLFKASKISTDYLNFDEQDKMITKELFYEHFEPIENCLG